MKIGSLIFLDIELVTARQQSSGKVMFSVVSVCHSVCHSVHRGSNVTITHDALDLTVQGPQPHPQLVTSGGHYWRHIETCSFEDPLPWSDIWLWLLKHTCMIGRSGQCTFYWNAFLFSMCCDSSPMTEIKQ